MALLKFSSYFYFYCIFQKISIGYTHCSRAGSHQWFRKKGGGGHRGRPNSDPRIMVHPSLGETWIVSGLLGESALENSKEYLAREVLSLNP